MAFAKQLAEASPRIKQAIQDAFYADPGLDRLGLYQQCLKLLIRPLSLLYETETGSPTIVVIDAVDECDGGEDISLLVRCLSELAAADKINVRVLITSRPDEPVNYGFRTLGDQKYEDFILHDIDESIINEDIRAFYRQKLTYIAQRYDFDDQWLPEDAIEKLTKQSSGLFIHAATVCRFIQDGGPVHAMDRLLLAVDADRNKGFEAQKELDKVYTIVLSQAAVPYHDPGEESRGAAMFRQIVGSIIISFNTLSLSTLCILLGEPEGRIKAMLSSLQSVLDVPNNITEPIRILHPSFRDFLLDPHRCLDKNFAISEQEAHANFLKCCLRRMEEDLTCKNICQLQLPGTRTFDISEETRDKYISIALRYSCRYWALHLQSARINPNEQDDILEFFKKRYVFWTEVMAIMGWMRDCVKMINAVGAILVVNSGDKLTSTQQEEGNERLRGQSLKSWVDDAQRFLLAYYTGIEQAPLQIYCSALLFCPEDSLIRKFYSSNIPKWIIERSVPFSNWSYIRQSFPHQSFVLSAAFSPNGSLLASAGYDKTVRLWDVSTGAELFVLKGHTLPVMQVAFSPDGSRLSSISGHLEDCDDIRLWGNELRIWDTVTGAQHATLPPIGNCSSIFFSPLGSLLATVEHASVRVWNPATGCELFSIPGPSSGGHCQAAFSTESQLVIAHRSKFIEARVYNIHSVTPTSSEMTTFTEVSAQKEYLRFTSNPREKALVAIKLFIPGTGPRLVPSSSSICTALAISTESQVIAASFDRGYLYPYDMSKELYPTACPGHSREVLSLAFGQKGSLLASGSVDHTIRLWSTLTGKLQFIIPTGEGIPRFFVFSPDGRNLATGLHNEKSVGIIKVSGDKIDLTRDEKRLSLYPTKFSLDSDLLLVETRDNKYQELRSLSTGARLPVEGQHFDYSHGDKPVICSMGTPGICVYERAGAVKRYQVKTRELSKIICSAVSPDGSALAVFAGVFLVVKDLGNQKNNLYGNHIVIESIVKVLFSPDSQRLAAGTEDGSIYLWQLPSLSGVQGLEQRYSGSGSSIKDMKFSSDGTWFAASYSSGVVSVWSVEVGSDYHCCLLTPSRSERTTFAFSPNKSVLAVASLRGRIEWWNISNKQVVKTLELEAPISAISFSDCGEYLVTDRGTLRDSSGPNGTPDELFASDSYIRKGKQNVIYIPPAYRQSILFTRGDKVLFNTSNSRPSSLRLETSGGGDTLETI